MIIRRKDNKKRRIASVGMMDGVHTGHRFLLDFLCAQGRKMHLSPAVITFGEHPLATVCPERAPKLLTTPERKLELLADSGVDDVVVLNFNHRMSRMSAEKFLEMLHERWGVEAMVVGFNNRFGRDRAEGIDAYRAIGAKMGMTIIEAPEMTTNQGVPLSSSSIRKALESGQVKCASEMLGYCYRLDGTVVHGQALGRKIGFPTANVQPVSPRLAVPGAGVYAAWVTTPDGVRRAAMVNIGVRPTVNESMSGSTIEAHIIDYAGCLYDEPVCVEFICRMREEQKFNGVDELVAQLRKDEKQVREMLSGCN
ncbi:MAG: riboflavin biosynthesis protein RibF [Paramuribaculum sp.]|nr:riboflavin biosynthesis protein RibF [Paramuribaculum sp.]